MALLSEAEVAAQMRRHRNWVAKQRKDGLLPYIQMSATRVAYRQADVDQFIATLDAKFRSDRSAAEQAGDVA